jgi:hypothetical protein
MVIANEHELVVEIKEEHEMLRQAVRDFAQNEIVTAARVWIRWPTC